MERFKNLLLVVNSGIKNPAALTCAFSLARSNGARLKIVDVVKETSSYQPILPSSAKNINLHDLIVQEKREHLEQMVRPFEKEGVDTSIRILTGIPFIEIIREVIRKDHDIVIVTPEGKSEFKDMLFGTTTMHLMRKCPSPVWAIKPSSDVPFPRILAAVDPGQNDMATLSLNRKILEMSSSLSVMQNSELHIIHVWDFLIRSVMIPKQTTDEMAEQVRTMRESWFEELLGKYAPDLPEKQVHLIKGEAGVQIPRLAKEKDIDLIVMGTVSRTGIPGLFIGNTAEKILYRVDCSVLAVKPDGFSSPVEVD
ncbi:MAG: universal stress protein [Nitrospiraceae bacterium]|nr:MAG: universal stress protein [Nitrospiraceae bacterium]